jgi:hypothetical protein
MSDTLTLNYVLKVFEHNFYCKKKRNVLNFSILDTNPDGSELLAGSRKNHFRSGYRQLRNHKLIKFPISKRKHN